MSQLFPSEIIENTVECYHAHIIIKCKVIYGLILLMILFVFASLPLVYGDVSFIYTKKVNLKLDFAFEIIENEQDLGNINGGFLSFSLPFNYMNGRSFIFAPYLQI